MQEQQRSYLLGVRITPQEKAELERLAKKTTYSEYLRQLVYADHRRHLEEAKRM